MTDVIYRKLIAAGYDALSLVIWSLVIASIVATLYLVGFGKKIKIPQTPIDIGLIVATGILFFVGFLILRMAQINSPNLGLVNAISYSSVIATLILMHYLYGDKLTMKALIGGVLIVTGIFMCVL